MSDGKKAYVRGTSGDDDLRAVYGDVDGTIFDALAGDDIMRGGNYNDIFNGGAGDDEMFGGLGADEFRFFANTIDGGQDTDFVYDLNFGQGDVLNIANFGAGTFAMSAGVNAWNGGSNAVIRSYEGIVNAVNGSANVTAFRAGEFNDDLILRVLDTDGDVQNIYISNGFSQYISAGGVENA